MSKSLKFLLILFISIPFFAFSHDKYFVLKSTIVDFKDNCDEITLEIENLESHEIRNALCGIKPSEIGTLPFKTSKNDFVVALAMNNQFKLSYTTKGYVPKIILVDTRIPNGTDADIYTMEFKIKLAPTDSDSSSKENFGALLGYSSTYNDFDFVRDSVKKATVFYDLGLHEYEKENYKDAIKYFTKTLQFAPGDIPALLVRAKSKVKQDDVEGACKDWMEIKNSGSGKADVFIQHYCTGKK